MLFATASPAFYTSLIPRPGVPHHNGSFPFPLPWNDSGLVSPFMNPLGLLLPPSTAGPDDLALRCHRCYLRPS